MATWKKVITVDDDTKYKNESITLAQLFAGLDASSTAGANQILKANADHNALIWADDNATTTIGALTDVSISSATDKEVLAYDNGSSEFINMTPSEAGLQTALTFGIANTNAVKIDHASVADNDFAKFTANGLEGRSYAQVLSDLSVTFGTANGEVPKVVTGPDANDAPDANDFAVFTQNAGQAGEGLKGLSAQEARTAMGVANVAGSTSQNFSTNDLAVTGDLTVTGTTISASSENILIEDSTMTLNSGAGSGSTNVDGGFIVERGADGDTAGLVGTDGYDVGIGFDESAGYFRFSSGNSGSGTFDFVADIPTATNHATNTAPANDDIGPIGSIHVATNTDAVYIRVD